jgi:hypothetical protein
VVDHHDDAFTGIERLFHLIDPQALKPVAYRRPARYGSVDAQPPEDHLKRSDGPSKANRSGQIDRERNHARSISMSAYGRIFWEVDRLYGLITFFLCFDRPLRECFDLLLFLLELLFQLGLEFGDLLAELAYFSDLRIPTPQEKRGDYVDR